MNFPTNFFLYLCHIGWSGYKVEESIFDVSLANEVTKHPDSLEHIDTVEKEDEYSVLSAVEDQRGSNLQVPVEPHHEEQT